MGKLLQIRVSAKTYSEDEVKSTWSNLYKLVWGDSANAVPSKGVVELAKAVADACRAGLIDDNAVADLKDDAQKAGKLCDDLEKALNDRDPQKADKLSYEIEDSLDAMEDIAKKF